MSPCSKKPKGISTISTVRNSMRKAPGGFSLPPSPPDSSDGDITLPRSERSRAKTAKRVVEPNKKPKNRRKATPILAKAVEGTNASPDKEAKRVSDDPTQNEPVKKAKMETSVEEIEKETIAATEPEPMKANASPDNQDEDESSQSFSSQSEQQEYEVETIMDYWVEGGKDMYLIKWLNWGPEHNSWEEKNNLHCEEVLKNFFFKRIEEIELCKQVNADHPRKLAGILKKLPLPQDPRPKEERVKYFFEKIIGTPPTDEELEEAWKLAKTGPKRSKWPMAKVDRYMQDAVVGNLSEENLNKLKEQLLPFVAQKQYEKQQKALKKWERKLNSITGGKPRLTVVNEVDLTGPPKDFTYINGYVEGKDVTIPMDPLIGCKCPETNCLRNKKACCAHANHESTFAYSQYKRVVIEPGNAIFECNRYCTCDMSCPNRVVQDGSISLQGARFCIFRTQSKGWGVKSMKFIKKGEFVAIYAGEIIRSEEAEERGKVYDQDGLTYLFDLDFNENPIEFECKYVVDAKKMGNFSHFFNHSCDPNLQVYNVFGECIDPDLPMLALFATRDISKGEELNFDYKSKSDIEEDQPKETQYKCFCGAPNCRKYFL